MHNRAHAIAAMDMCTAPTVTFEWLFVSWSLAMTERRLLRIEVTDHPTVEWLARQITEAFAWAAAPAYLVCDDRADGQTFTARVMAMGIWDHPISPRSHCQNGIVELPIGTLRRACLDGVLVYGEGHLCRVLLAYAAYYNRSCTHLAVHKNAPLQRAIQRIGNIAAISILGGLHHKYVRM